MADNRIVVLRQKIHGMDAAEYAEALRRRLPEWTVTLATTPGEKREALRTARVATGHRLSAGDLAIAENLELFACVFAGTGHLNHDAFEEHGVAVTSAAGVHGPNVSEYVVGAMVSHAKEFQRARRQNERREWRSYQTRELYGSTATVVGLGAIGRAIVDRLDPFGMETVGVRYTPEKGGPTDEVWGFDAIHEAVASAEYVVLACPLTDTTAELIDDDVLRTMHPDAVLVNVARGRVVDTDALVSALRWNDIAGATLDVTDPEPLPEDHPLWGMENVTVTPHNAGYTPEYFDRRVDILANNATKLDGDGELENRVV
jgi:phosphoglycerate dehydrogenase-like enzyme